MKNYQDISQYIKLHCKNNSKKIAIVFEDKKISYEKLEQLVSNLSLSFLKLGISKGDRLAVVLSNSLEFIYILFAAARVGAVIVPYNLSLPPNVLKKNFIETKINYLIGWHKPIQEIFKISNIEKIIRKKKTITVGTKIKGFYYFDDLLKTKKNTENYKMNIKLINEIFIIASTSGSTGNPKPIVLTQKTKLLRSKYTIKAYGLNSKSVIITSTPLYHTLAQRLVLISLIVGGTSVIMPGFSNKKWVKDVIKNKVTFSILVSSQLENLISFKKNIFKKLKSLKTVVASSSKLHENVRKKIYSIKKPNIYEIYGTSEIAAVTNMKINKDSDKINSVGKPISIASVKIIDNKNKFQKKGKIGEIICKTPLIFSGYMNKPKETSSSFYKGYFKTGDMGYFDKDNYLYYSSRKKNIIIVGGINVYPEDIEKCLKNNYQIKDSCVFGIKNTVLGEQVVAAVIPRKKSINEIKLRKYCLQNLADFQQPAIYYYIKKFPKNSLGKIDRKTLIKNFISKKN